MPQPRFERDLLDYHLHKYCILICSQMAPDLDLEYFEIKNLFIQSQFFQYHITFCDYVDDYIKRP